MHHGQQALQWRLTCRTGRCMTMVLPARLCHPRLGARSCRHGLFTTMHQTTFARCSSVMAPRALCAHSWCIAPALAAKVLIVGQPHPQGHCTNGHMGPSSSLEGMNRFVLTVRRFLWDDGRLGD